MNSQSTDLTKTKVNLYLCGGGVKCSYQASFLKNLSTDHEVDNAVCLSFGSLVGYSIILGLHDEIITFCKTLTPDALVPCFSMYNTLHKFATYFCRIPIIGQSMYNFLNMVIKMIWILIAVRRKSFYIPTFGEKYLDKISLHKKNNLSRLSKFWCVVYNVTNNKIELINGTHPLIEKYIIASCSLWIIFPPINIQRLSTECICDINCDCDKSEFYCKCSNQLHKYNEYIDPGFIMTIPYIPIPEINNDNKNLIFTSFDINNRSKQITTGSNLIEYLDNMIGMTSKISQEVFMKNWIINNETYIINYDPPTTSPTNINSQVINKIMKDGDELYNVFKEFKLHQHQHQHQNHQNHHEPFLIQL